MKKLISALLCMSLLLTCASALAGQTEGNGPVTHRLESRQAALYLTGAGKLEATVPYYLADGVGDMPYMDLKDVLGIYDALARLKEAENIITGEYDRENQVYTFTNKFNKSTLSIGMDDGVVLYDGFDSLMAESKTATYLDVLYHPGVNQANQPELFQRMLDPLMTRPGNLRVIRLGDYGIPCFEQDGKCLLPLHTALDLTMCMPSSGLINLFNGEAIFLITGISEFYEAAENADPLEALTSASALNEMGKAYYNAPKKERSKIFANYGLSELCMELDHFYGLKDAHNVTSFMDIVLATDYYDRLTSKDARTADEALQDFINYYLDDLHSAYKFNSWLTGADTELKKGGAGFSTLMDAQNTGKYGAARLQAYPDGWIRYEEVGDTAYVTFDTFGYNPETDYYALDLNDTESITDTVSLIMYAHSRITRENSPIKRVVLDMSNNIGGQADAAIFTIGWFLGTATVTNVNTFSGAQATSQYAVDANRDRKFDENDYLAGRYELFCLTSPVSFSCGNLVPWVFKGSGMVTLLGAATGGGSCIVKAMSTAWGTNFQMSGYNRLAFVKNGSYYDVDRGVEPDVTITKTKNFYDRQALNKILDSCY